MNKHFTWFIFHLCCICGLLLTGCSDDESGGSTLVPSGEDSFVGDSRIVRLTEETEDFRSNTFKCDILAENGTIITRRGDHVRLGQESTLTFETGLKPGIYRLLCLKTLEVEDGDTTWVEFGLGCRVEITAADSARILDVYSKAMKLCGSGTEEDPFIISSYDHFKRLRDVANDQVKNNLLFSNTHFLQTNDIDMDRASWDSDHEAGWLPIGNLSNNPFRGIYDGDGHKVKNLWSFRGNSAGVGLFGFVENSVFKNVKMENARVEGNYAVGSLIGGSVTAGDKRGKTGLFNCITTDGYIKASAGSVGIGGLVGVVDMYGLLNLYACVNESTSVSGSYAIGGLLGAGSLYSTTMIEECENDGDVTSEYTGAGGLAGSVDTLIIASCENRGHIKGSISYQEGDENNGGYGTGGIVGGSGISYIYTCFNTGDVEGSIGVGGIIGSTRLGTEELTFNNTLLKVCSNAGKISGKLSVGGLCGEAQFGGVSVYNTGDVSATGDAACVGGIAGNTSIAVVHDALNTGKICSYSMGHAGGVLGKTAWGAIFSCQNFGDLDVKAEHAGGVIGLAGNYTMVNYCANMGFVKNQGSGVTGGVLGEVGDPREWSATDIVGVVIGSAEIALLFGGPVIGVVGKALGETVETVLHVGEVLFDALFLLTDSGLLTYGVYGMLTEEEASLMRTSINSSITDKGNSVKQEIADIRNGYSLASGILYDQLNPQVVIDYNTNLSKLLAYYESSNENAEQISLNINLKREERYEEIEHWNHVKEITQKVIAGACIAAGTIAWIGSMVATAGSTAAAGLALVGFSATLIGGTNAIIESCTNFQNNVVVVSQCVNMGKLEADDGTYAGGIVGYLQQRCIVEDCLNLGVGDTGALSGGIAGKESAEAYVRRCLHVGKSWFRAVLGSPYDVDGAENCYYFEVLGNYDGTGVPLSLDKLKKASYYHTWDINGTNSVWHLTEKDGFFPIPFHSEME